jgi:hypothetical protein
MARYTIAVVAKLARRKIAKSKHQCRAGSQADIRKNPHVIDAGLRPDITVSCWYTMWMATSITVSFVI